MSRRARVVAMLGGCAVLALPGLAQAQTQTPPGAEAENPPQASPDTAEDEQIVVTGSRIQNGNTSPTPVTILDAQTLETFSPASIADGLNRLPQFIGSSSQLTNGNASSNTVGNFLNLRGLGSTRTLILFDGHRMPDTAQAGGVDVNTIPQLLLQRVDVVTGGASAVYGSDAVAGVVNFVIDRRFTGLRLQAESGISGEGDNATQRFGIGFGTDLLAGRGHLLLSYNYINSEGIDAKAERSNGALVPNLVGAGSAASPFVPVLNARLAIASVGGLITNGPRAGQQFGPGGTIIPFNLGTATPSPGFRSGGDGIFFDTGLFASLETHQAFGRFDYEFSDALSAYVQGSYTRTENEYPFVQYQLTNLTLFTNNAFLPAASAAALQQGGATTFTISKVAEDYSRVASRTENYFINTGLRGSLGSSLNWDVSYTRAQTRQTTANRFNINNAAQAAALDAVRAPDGSIVCQVTLTDPSRFPGCVPLNLFGPGSITPAALDFISDETRYVLTQQMDNISASLTGSLFSTGAGPVRFAINGEYRDVSLDLTSNAQPLDRANCTNLRLNCTATTARYRSNVVANATGSQTVTEIAGELDVPLLHDLPLIDSLSISGAARYTNYNTSGSVTTWKAGIDWRPIADLRVRATRSRDIRAPNLNELFAPTNQSPSGFNDIHTGQSGILQIVSSGNLNLRPEVADTLTAGIVYNPTWLPRFSIAIDYYDIKINDAIANVSGITASPICEASNGTDPLCALIVRPLPFADRTPANFPTTILSQPQNVGSFRQTGIDTEINYSFPLAGGTMSLRALTTYIDSQTSQQFSTSPVVEYAGTIGNASGVPATPRWRVAFFTTYTNGDWTLNALARYRSSLAYNKDPRLVYNVPDVGSVTFVDAAITRRIPGMGGEAEFYISVQNLFDTQAPIYYPNIGAPGFQYPAVNGDDVIGRRFNVGIRARF